MKNERQQRITKAQAARFALSLDSLDHRDCEPAGVHPRVAQAQREALESQLRDLEAELREYESLNRRRPYEP